MAERIWDRFLTNADKDRVERLPTRSWGMGESPALLMVDLYRKAFEETEHDKPRSAEAIPTMGAASKALPQLLILLNAARAARIPVIHITGLTNFPRWSDGFEGKRSQERTEVGSEERRRAYEIVPELAPIEDEPVVLKASPSAFWGTPLPGLVNRLGVDTLIVGGTATSGCVRATVVDGRSHQYRMVVVEECVFDRHEASHAISLFDMNRKYADVVGLDSILSYLSDRSP